MNGSKQMGDNSVPQQRTGLPRQRSLQQQAEAPKTAQQQSGADSETSAQTTQITDWAAF
ncbi:MAG: hypothetical protein H6901_02155 [Rhodobacteraceae bacterium]|nr:hypothetical protein [Paracoccaceae bacterium]MCP5341004.1 hypothetical protein [Paracoccaceae bacterium]